MKKSLPFFLIDICLIIALYGCIQPFSPPEVNSDKSYLVVDGFLNFGEDTTKIMLSRTQNTTEKEGFTRETGAQIQIEAESGEIYQLTELEYNGTYYLLSPITNQNTKYRVVIKTGNGDEFESDFVKVDQTPAIDSIGHRVDPTLDAMIFSVNAHDATNNTRFYRWKFEETWMYRAPLFSYLEVVGTGENKQLIPRNEYINTCYSTINSTSIILGSTIRLSQDIIKDLPVHTVSIGSNKLLLKYSILVRQYGLSREAFEYWTSLSQSTQGNGSLFDPLPSQVTGNVRNKKDPQELVFGFFSASIERKKRIFVSPGLGRYTVCEPDTIPVACLPNRQTDCALETSGLILSYADPFQTTVTVATPTCVDCRLQGGVITKPAFWE